MSRERIRFEVAQFDDLNYYVQMFLGNGLSLESGKVRTMQEAEERIVILRDILDIPLDKNPETCTECGGTGFKKHACSFGSLVEAVVTKNVVQKDKIERVTILCCKICGRPFKRYEIGGSDTPAVDLQLTAGESQVGCHFIQEDADYIERQLKHTRQWKVGDWLEIKLPYYVLKEPESFQVMKDLKYAIIKELDFPRVTVEFPGGMRAGPISVLLFEKVEARWSR